MDSQQLQQATSNPNIQRVLQKQASLSKRLSTAGSQFMDHHHQQQGHSAAAAAPSAAMASAAPGGGGHSNTRIKMPETSYSHTETAV